MALAAHLLYDRLQALLPHCSEIEALKLELATDMDHVSPEVRNLLGLATIDLMACANQVAASVADAVLGHEVTESASQATERLGPDPAELKLQDRRAASAEKRSGALEGFAAGVPFQPCRRGRRGWLFRPCWCNEHLVWSSLGIGVDQASVTQQEFRHCYQYPLQENAKRLDLPADVWAYARRCYLH